jgi:hypothetical protein
MPTRTLPLAAKHSMFRSTFTAKLGTNYCPTSEELLEIEALLVEPDLRLKRLDDEIGDKPSTSSRENAPASVHTWKPIELSRRPSDAFHSISSVKSSWLAFRRTETVS